MLAKIFSISILIFILVLIDLYIYQALRIAISGLNQSWIKGISTAYWIITLISIGGIFYYNFGNSYFFGRAARSMIVTGVFINYFSKIFAVLVLFVDDGRRVVQWIIAQFNNPGSSAVDGESMKISRSEFMAKTALVAAVVPFATMGFGIVSGAHDYRIRRKTIQLPGLPKEFDGIRIAQLSDIHSGSFYNKKAVKGGVEMLMAEKPDIFCNRQVLIQ